MKRSFLMAVALLGLCMSDSSAAPKPKPVATEGIREGVLIHVQPGPVETSVLYAGGRTVRTPTQIVTRPMCGSDLSQITQADLAQWAQQAQTAAALTTGVEVISPGRAQRGPGTNIVFNASGTLPSGAAEALDAAAAYIESKFWDPITVNISCDFSNLGSGILGGTSSYYKLTTWPDARNGLIAGKDPNDVIQDFLPAGDTFSVRYDGTSQIVNMEDRVWVTRANYKATIGTTFDLCASMSFNNQFPWDFDPSNGVTGGTYCFQSVIIHEVGHCLGFTSAEDFRTNDCETLDLFRFQRTASNPGTYAEFLSTPRLVDYNVPNDDQNSDIITIEYRMSDGTPYQASHFREQSPNIGIMDPAMGSSSTFYPEFFRPSDLDMFDAIGYDYPDAVIDVTPPTPDPMTFASFPNPTGPHSVSMQATTAADPTGPLEYLFQEITGNPGDPLDWQTTASLVHAGLQPNTLYRYQVSARDGNLNQTASSGAFSAVTSIETPTAIVVGNVTQTTVELVAVGPFTNLGVGNSGLYFDSTTTGGDGGLNVWTQSTSTTATGLQPGKDYTFRVKARNQNGIETNYSTTVSARTDRLFLLIPF